MTETYTIQQIIADEVLLRRLAGEVLTPESWEHNWVDAHPENPEQSKVVCAKCGAAWCSGKGVGKKCAVPDSPTDPIPVIADDLVKKCDRKALVTAIGEYKCLPGVTAIVYLSMIYEWWIFEATPATQSAICLAVLLPEKVKVTK